MKKILPYIFQTTVLISCLSAFSAYAGVTFIDGSRGVKFNFTCPENQVWYEGRCVQKCDRNYYLYEGQPDPNIGTFETCDDAWGSYYVYTACFKGWTLKNGLCEKDIVECWPHGWGLDETGQCVPTCVGKDTKPDNCAWAASCLLSTGSHPYAVTIKYGDKCAVCEEGYYTSNYSCVPCPTSSSCPEGSIAYSDGTCSHDYDSSKTPLGIYVCGIIVDTDDSDYQNTGCPARDGKSGRLPTYEESDKIRAHYQIIEDGLAKIPNSVRICNRGGYLDDNRFCGENVLYSPCNRVNENEKWNAKRGCEWNAGYSRFKTRCVFDL